jgi:multiple sugar transport system substrate-binding protein
MSETLVSNYLGGISVSLSNSNMVLDLRVPQSALYQREILDTAIADFLTGKITRDQAIQKIEQEWEKVTNQTGRDSQLQDYRDSLGIE